MTEKTGKKSKNESAQETAPPPASPLAVRTALKALKILFVWLPLALVFLVVLALLAAQIYLTPRRVENLVTAGFKSASHGEIRLSVKRFNPYRGFIIENLEIRNGEEFGRTKFLEVERLVLDYRFFPLFIGNVYFNEIGIYRPRIYLQEKNGVWNAARLMKETEKKEEKKKEEEKKADEGPPPKEINLPVSVKLLFKFVLDDLRVYARGSTFTSSIEGLSSGVDIYIPPFKKIPLSLDAVSLLERMKIVLNPGEEMDVSFSSREAGVQPPLVLTWKLEFEKNRGRQPLFGSVFKFGTYRTPVRFKQTHLAPLHFMLSYDLFYEPSRDRLSINHFGLRFLGRKWLFLSGTVDGVTTNQTVDIKMTESAIVLDDLYPYFRALTGDRTTSFGGVVSLFPLTVRGTPASLDIKGELNLRELRFKNPSAQATIPRLQLAYTVLKRGDAMKVLSRLRVPHLFYVLDRNKSGDNGFELGADLDALGNFGRVKLNNLFIRLYNPLSGKNALYTSLNGDIALKPEMAGVLKMTAFRFDKPPLMEMLPRGIRKSLESVPLKQPVDMTMDLGFGLGKNIVRADLGMMVKVPDFDINDLAIGVGVVQDNRRQLVTLKRLSVKSPSRNLSIDGGGTVELNKTPFSDSNLKLSVKLDSPKMKAIYGPWNISGLIELSTAVRGDMKDGRAFGTVKIVNFNVKNDQSKLYVDEVNLDFPFEYYFTPRYRGDSRLVVDKTSVIGGEHFRKRENFTIKSIRAKHPGRDRVMVYMRDFSATMFFRDNTFEISTLKATALDGAIYGRDIFFNLADMKPRNMEFRYIMDVTNVDIGVLDDPDRAAKTRDAELSLNANFSGRGLDVNRELNVQGYINIYRVGEKFANRLLKGLSEEQGKSKLGALGQFAVDNSMSVKGFNFNLDKGLVYTTVTFSRRTFGYLFGVKDEKVEFQRMPIQEYLRKVREVEQ
ncbi:MAG TPA: hypothetical protein ENN21_10130 [Spirochaetes bacterium]|nr:hypothetical protein [Spirochaetota bacterium]